MKNMKDFTSVILRLFLYALVLLTDYFIIYADIIKRSVKEDSAIEIAQEFYLFIIVVILIIQSFRIPTYKNLCYILALFFAMHLVREFDFFLDMIFDGLWQIIAFSMLGLAVFLFVKNKHSTIQQIGALKNDISAGLFLIGLTLLHVFSRLWGKSDNWKTLLEDNYKRVFKDLAEEGIELVSYSILLIATIQLFLTLKSSISKDGE
jgi:hypothetical protein